VLTARIRVIQVSFGGRKIKSREFISFKRKGVVKKVVRGCCYAEWGSKRKTMLVLPAQENYDSYS